MPSQNMMWELDVQEKRKGIFTEKDNALGQRIDQKQKYDEVFLEHQYRRDSFFNNNCMTCVPGAPIPGLIDAEKNIQFPLPRKMEKLLKEIKDDIPSTSTDRLKKCSDTVYSLREFHKQNGLDKSINMIQGFEKSCLAKDVSELQFSECRLAYSDYVKSCLQNTSGALDQRIVNRIGILMVAQGMYKGTPACTATVISEKYLISARHCYVAKEGENEKTPDGDYLTFIPNPKLIKSMSDSGMSFNGQIAGELTSEGVKEIELSNNTPSTSQDVIILVLKEPIQLEKPELKIKLAQEVKSWQQLTLLGYQEMVTRNDDLNSQGFHLPDGKSPNYYIQNIMMDSSMSCFVGALQAGGFKHNCQTFYGTSGAPFFIGDLSDMGNDGIIYIAGVQSAGNSSSTKELERQGAPNTAATITSDTISILLNNGVDLR